MPLLPPSTTTVLPAKRMASEHAVGIGRLLRDRLGHVPVLGDLAVLDTQDVDDRKPAISGRELRMRVHDHEITLRDRKSTRLNSSHGYISYAVFCLKKKKIRRRMTKSERHKSI